MNVEGQAHGIGSSEHEAALRFGGRLEAKAFALQGLKWLFWRLHMTYVQTFEENAMQQQTKL